MVVGCIDAYSVEERAIGEGLVGPEEGGDCREEVEVGEVAVRDAEGGELLQKTV